MKVLKIKFLQGALLVVLILATSCKKQLELYPADKYSSENYWTSELNAQMALMGVLRGNIYMTSAEYNPTDWWSYWGLLFLEMSTDNAYDRRLNNSVYNKLTNGTNTATNSLLGNYWTNSYRRIALCNDFLANINKVPMSETNRKRMIGEVRFIRACQYFYMSQYWGSVPLVTTLLSSQEANTVTKATKKEIIDFVIKEFTEAAADMPRFKDIPIKEIGRPCKQAALAFLGRMQLSDKQFAAAAATYKSIIDFGDNQIDPDYITIFLESNENSSENIFSVQFEPLQGGNGMLQHLAPALMNGWILLDPLSNLMESYQFTDGTPFSFTDPKFDYKDISKNRDPRLKYTIFYNEMPFRGTKFISHPDSTKAPDMIAASGKFATQTGYGLRKYIPENFTGTGAGLYSYGGNMPVIRYAEVLLSYLEAKLEAGDAIDQALLDATVNKVRGRASVNMPRITITNAATLRPLLRNERRVELALEGLRYWDLLRWGIAGDVLQGDFYGHPYPGAKRTKKKGTFTDPYSRWYVTSKNFRKGVDELWPIPQSELNINPNLNK